MSDKSKSKIERQSKIIDIIKARPIETQEELTRELLALGFKITQATVSRDIRDLNLSKFMDEGTFRYMTMEKSKEINDRLIGIFSSSVKSVEYSFNIVVIKTFQGMAMAVAAAVDAMPNTYIMGSIAGDDTIFCVMPDPEHSVRLVANLKKLLPIV